jgi:hypothetical protein
VLGVGGGKWGLVWEGKVEQRASVKNLAWGIQYGAKGGGHHGRPGQLIAARSLPPHSPFSPFFPFSPYSNGAPRQKC